MILLILLIKQQLKISDTGYCKYALGINKSSSNFGTRNEIGRYPIECHIKTQTIMYLARLFTDNLNPLLIESFNLTKSLDACNIYTWFTYAKDILMETGIDIEKLKTCHNIKQLKNIKKYIKCEINNHYQNLFDNKLNSIDDKSKLNFYKELNPNFCLKPYLTTSNFEYRKLITKLRISDHSLLIEKGRHFKIPREERLCLKCKIIDDEKHFLLDCSSNSNFRTSFFNDLTIENENFLNLPNSEKIIYILNTSTPTQVNKLGSFIKKSLGLRTGDP